jgi:hypothetical protein
MTIATALLAVATLAPGGGDYAVASRLAPTLACRSKLEDARKVMAPAGAPEVKVVDGMTFLTWDRAPAKDGAACSVSLAFEAERLTRIADSCVGPPDFMERFVFRRHCE